MERKIKTFEKECIFCHKKYLGTWDQKYCSKDCALEYYGKKSHWKGLSSGTVGAIQELRVSVDLLSKGYEVYRALSPNSSCDLLLLKNEKPYTIEVRTAYQHKGGNLCYSPRNIRAKFLALVLPDKIIYKPDLI